MATLYELDERIKRLSENLEINEETGEIENAEELEELEMQRNEKIENVALWIKNLSSDIEAYSAEEKSFKRKKEIATKKRDYLKNFLQGFLDGSKYKSARVNISYRNSKKVIIDSIEDVPESFLKIKVELEVFIQ